MQHILLVLRKDAAINTFVTILISVLIFGALIFVHELGHFTTARIFGVTVREFAIGMGPKILSHTSKKSGIAYSLRLLPFGGFVSMVGEDEDTVDPNALNKKPVWQRAIIMAAGSFMNLLLGFILMFVMVASSSTIGGTVIAKFATEDASSQASGLMIGDELLKIGGTGVHTSTELVYEVMRNGTEPIDVTVRRGGEKLVIGDVVFPTTMNSGVVFGETDFYVYSVDKTPWIVIRNTWYQSISSVKMIWESLFDLVTGKYGVDQVSGPVGVTEAIGQAASTSSTSLLYICTLIAINLGVVNLMPLPALDGGRIFFLLIELVRGKPVKPEFEGYIHFAGIVLLMLLMVFITYKDIMNIFVK